MPTLLAWASPSYGDTTLISGTQTGIGYGAANTAAILAVDANAPAAKACNGYTNNGKDDWFLPSRDELNEMWIKGIATSGNWFETAASATSSTGFWYWSSSQRNTNTAQVQKFDNGAKADYHRTNEYRVRPVRAF